MSRDSICEFLGTAFLLMIITGSGIMATSLSSGNQAIILLANSIATGAGLYCLITTFGSISLAHFNPLVTLIDFLDKKLSIKSLLSIWGSQFLGAMTGVFCTHLMFNEKLIQVSAKNRNEPHLFLAEVIATFGLLLVIRVLSKKNRSAAPLAISLYIVSAYWFTSSTSFANPAVTLARGFTDTFCGIAPNAIAPFIVSQFLGALAAYGLLKDRWLSSNE